MEKSLFDDLLQSVKEAKAIANCELEAPRRYQLVSIDVHDHRERLGLTQEELAAHLQIDLLTLAIWEQHCCMREEYAVLLIEMSKAVQSGKALSRSI